MKLCMIAPVPPPYGGISNWYLLSKEYIEHSLPNIQLSTVNIAPKLRSTDGRSLFDRIVGSGIEMLKKRSELKRLIKACTPDVIHMTTSGQLAVIRDILLLKIARKYNIPTVYHIRFGRIPQISSVNSREWKLLKKAMELSTVTIAIDSETYNSIKQTAPNVKAEYIPNPVDFSKLPSLSQNHNNNVVFLGWVVNTKGVEELIEAWNSIGYKFPEYTLEIIGPGTEKYMELLKEKCTAPNICFCGEISHDDAMKRVSECGLFVLPSYTEGFPNAVVEAMALGRPVIATTVGAIPDMLSEGCGKTVEPKSSSELAAEIEIMLGDDNKRFEYGIRAREKALSQYSVEQIFNKYLRLWNDVTR